MNKKVLELKNVSKSFFTMDGEIKVLDKINFSINHGEKVAIVGPSGCGKSTILNLISNLIKPSSGDIATNGDVGYMFQRDYLLAWRSVYKNITLGLEIKGKISKEKKKQIIELLKKYDLYEFKDRYPHELSGGMRQRVALIRTLVMEPEILLLDEPFSSLDAQSKLLVNEDVYKIVSKEEKTVILVTHDISEAIAFCDKIIVLTDRPARIKKVHEISFEDLENRTPMKTREHKMFKDYFNCIWKELEENGRKEKS